MTISANAIIALVPIALVLLFLLHFATSIANFTAGLAGLPIL